MADSGSSPTGVPERSSRRTTWLLFVVIHVASALVMVVPAFALFVFTLFSGGALGWWPNDPTNNDGAPAPILFALVALGICGGIAALTALVTRRVVRPRPSAKTAALGLLGVVIAVALAISWYEAMRN